MQNPVIIELLGACAREATRAIQVIQQTCGGSGVDPESIYDAAWQKSGAAAVTIAKKNRFSRLGRLRDQQPRDTIAGM